MSEWQDISTAPKDGTWVLGYESGVKSKRYVPHEVLHWHSGYWRDSSAKVSKPIYWQPLPDPPKSETQDGM